MARRFPRLSAKARRLAPMFIGQEIRTGKYDRAQAVRIGLERARRAARRNPGPKGIAKIGPLMKAASRSRSTRRFLALQGAGTRRILVGIKRRQLRSVLANPAPKGARKAAAFQSALARRMRVRSGGNRDFFRQMDYSQAILRRRGLNKRGAAKTAALLAGIGRRERLAVRRGRRGLQVKQHALSQAAQRRYRIGLFPNPRRRRRRNPKRGATMARRRRRSAAQRAAFRRMIAGLKRHMSRKRNPRKRGKHMARRRHKARRRRAAIVMINPRRHRKARRRRNPSRVRFHRRRRRNPEGGAGVKGAIRSVFMAAIPALGGGFVANFIDAKFLSDKGIVWRILAKLGLAGVAAAIFRRRPVIAYATMGAIVGSIGGDFGTSMGGGAVVGGTPVAKAAGVAALITEDPRAMGVLVQGMRGMGYQIDSNVSLGDMTPLPAGSYQDVNLG